MTSERGEMSQHTYRFVGEFEIEVTDKWGLEHAKQMAHQRLVNAKVKPLDFCLMETSDPRADRSIGEQI